MTFDNLNILWESKDINIISMLLRFEISVKIVSELNPKIGFWYAQNVYISKCYFKYVCLHYYKL